MEERKATEEWKSRLAAAIGLARTINRDFLVLLGIGFIAGLWLLFAGRNGYTGGNAMIVARSVSVVAAIDGEVDNLPVKVGSHVAEGELLARIQNGRMDRSRLVDLDSQIEFYRGEIANGEAERKQLSELLEHFEKQSTMHVEWLVQDLRLRRQETLLELNRAKERGALKSAENERTMQLAKKNLVSVARSESARAEAAIARDQIEALKSQLARIDLMLRSIEGKGSPRDDGDTSYWEKTADALRLRLFDNQIRAVSLKAQLAKAETQAKEERKRVSLNVIEEHRAPVSGLVNAVFTTEGKRVTAGAPMLEVLDCAHPIAIVAIPDNRFGEFRIGQKATVKPIDSDETFAGTIQHISSGPLIGRDTTISVQPTVTIDGNKAIVGLEGKSGGDGTGDFCNSARRAIVTIHTPSLFDWITGSAQAESKSAGMDSAIAIRATSAQNLLAPREAHARSR